MKRKLNTVRQILHRQSLSATERNQLRSTLQSYITNRPAVRNLAADRHILPIGSFRAASFLTSKGMLVSVVIMLLVVAGGGATFAAEQALPGDFLYPLKVNLTEELRGALNFSTEAQADWAIERLERRLIEAEQLNVAQRLDERAKDQIERRVSSQAQAVVTLAAQLKARGQTAAAAGLESGIEAALRGHAEAMLSIISNNVHAADIAVGVTERAQATAEDRIETEHELAGKVSAEVKAAAEGKMNAASHKLAEVERFVNSKKGSVSAEIFAAAQARLTAAQAIFTQGKVDFEAGAYGEAFVAFQQAIRSAQEANIIIAAAERLHMESWIKIGPDATSTLMRQRDDDDELDDQSTTSTSVEILLDAAQKMRSDIRSRLEQRGRPAVEPGDGDDVADDASSSSSRELFNRTSVNTNTDVEIEAEDVKVNVNLNTNGSVELDF